MGAQAVIGWFALLLLIAASLAALWAMGLRGGLLQLAGAALLFGASGYAVQGRPDLPGASSAGRAKAPPIPLTNLRHAFFGRFNASEHWQAIAESYARRGDTGEAVGAMKAAVRARPNDPALWIGLGNALVDHAGVLTPASQLAYGRAAELAPDHPAPPFFLGLALARSGDRDNALAMWRAILAESPPEASWRPLVEDAIAALDRHQTR